MTNFVIILILFLICSGYATADCGLCRAEKFFGWTYIDGKLIAGGCMCPESPFLVKNTDTTIEVCKTTCPSCVGAAANLEGPLRYARSEKDEAGKLQCRSEYTDCDICKTNPSTTDPAVTTVNPTTTNPTPTDSPASTDPSDPHNKKETPAPTSGTGKKSNNTSNSSNSNIEGKLDNSTDDDKNGDGLQLYQLLLIIGSGIVFVLIAILLFWCLFCKARRQLEDEYDRESDIQFYQDNYQVPEPSQMYQSSEFRPSDHSQNSEQWSVRSNLQIPPHQPVNNRISTKSLNPPPSYRPSYDL